MRYGMVIDLKRCVGCNSCTVACKQVNGTPPGVLRTKVLITEKGTYPNVRLDFLPMLCMHCEQPECERVCPVGATQKQENGIVTIDQERCIGCQFCLMACPYGARTFVDEVKSYFPGKGSLTAYEKARYADHAAGVCEKCDFCADRVAAGQEPACVATCAARARIFGDLDDPESEVSKLIAQKKGAQLLPELKLNPSVYYINR